MLPPWAGRSGAARGLTPAGAGDVVGRPVLSDNARLAQRIFRGCGIPGRGDGIGRRSGLKHRRRKAWGFDFPPRHQQGRRIEARWQEWGVWQACWRIRRAPGIWTKFES